MLRNSLSVLSASGTLLLTSLLVAPSSHANIQLSGGDIFLDGSFQGMSYGISGVANLVPRLYVGEFASTVPPFDQIIGTGLEFDYVTSGFGTPTFTVTYRLTNNDVGGPFNDLRFFLDLKTKGQSGANDQGAVQGFGGPASAGAPDQFQIFDFDALGDKPLQLIETSNMLNGSAAAACSTGCYTDLALQWNKPTLLVGETWQITVTLTDNLGLISSGRYLTASTLGLDNTQIAFGAIQLVPEPETYMMLLAGLGLVGMMVRNRKNAPG